MTLPYALLIVISLVAAAIALRLMLWRALLVFRPSSVRIEIEDPPGHGKPPAGLAPTLAQIEALGFLALGTHSERPPLGPVTLCFDYARTADGTYATAYLPDDGLPRVYFLSVLAGGGFVITANYRRPARTIDGQYQSGGLEEASVDRVFKAHLRLLKGRALESDLSLDGRVAAARAWYLGPGRPEVRQQNFRGLLWSVATLGMVAAAIFARH